MTSAVKKYFVAQRVQHWLIHRVWIHASRIYKVVQFAGFMKFSKIKFSIKEGNGLFLYLKFSYVTKHISKDIFNGANMHPHFLWSRVTTQRAIAIPPPPLLLLPVFFLLLAPLLAQKK